MTSHSSEKACELANRSAWDRPLRAPDDSRVRPIFGPPASVERLEIGAIVGDENAATGRRDRELVFIG